MNMERKNRIEEVMNSLEGIQKAKAPRDGFAKIQQKLANQRREQPTLSKPDYGWMKVAAVIALVVCSNVWAVSNYWGADRATSADASAYPQLVTDFNLYENE